MILGFTVLFCCVFSFSLKNKMNEMMLRIKLPFQRFHHCYLVFQNDRFRVQTVYGVAWIVLGRQMFALVQYRYVSVPSSD